MENYLKGKLKEMYPNIKDEYVFYEYNENTNKDVDSKNTWLDSRTSYIYKVSVLTAIDNNKCDYAYVIIGVQRSKNASPEVKGFFYFDEGENDDMGRVVRRSMELLYNRRHFDSD